jgi:cephalosporin hydroxylase
LSEHEKFLAECAAEIVAQGQNKALRSASAQWIGAATPARYSYHFSALGRPIIQYPQDIVAMQELVWRVRPDVIIETGIAHGGSLILSASMLALLDYCDAVEAGEMLDPRKPGRRVIGVDIDIREHNRSAIEAHPLANRIDMIEGSSIDPNIIEQVRKKASAAKAILVSLDSNHTHDHVLAELEAYSPLVTSGSYCVVFDTIIEDLPAGTFPDRPWDKGNNPKTAIWEFVKTHREFEIDKFIDNKLLISVAPSGFLRRR